MAHPRALDPAPGGKLQEDAAIAALATRQHGVVARRQLLAIGVGSRAIEHRVDSGRLHPVQRGVYAVGHRSLTERGRYPKRKGSAQVRGLLRANRIGRTRTRSELEVAFVAFLDAHDLPRPDLNVPMTVAGRELVADCVWWEARVIVELDVVHTHGGAGSFHDDRERDRVLQVLGWRTARVTDRHLEAAPAAVARDLRKLLSERPKTLRTVG